MGIDEHHAFRNDIGSKRTRDWPTAEAAEYRNDDTNAESGQPCLSNVRGSSHWGIVIGAMTRWRRAHVLVKLTFQSPVVEFSAPWSAAPKVFFKPRVRCDNIETPGRQRIADSSKFAIDRLYLFRRPHAFTVRRIADDNSIFTSRFKFTDLLNAKLNIA